MSVHKDERKNGQWVVCARYEDFAKEPHQHKKRGFATKREALEYERQYKAEQRCAGLTFNKLRELYMDDCTHRVRKTTIDSITLSLNRMTPYLERYEVKDITPQVVRQLQIELLDKNYSPGTVKETVGKLSAMMNYGVRYYNLPSNPCRVAGNIKKTQAKELVVWSNDEFKRFIATRRKPIHRLLYTTLFYTGLRIGELLGLTWEDVDGDVLHINKQWLYRRKEFGSTKTPQSVRDVPIPQFLQEMFRLRPYDYKPTDRVFNISAGSVDSALKTGIKKAGLPAIKIHGFRHSHISMLISLGVPIPAVAKRVGHSSTSTTMSVYAHAYKHDEYNVANVLDTTNKNEPPLIEPPKQVEKKRKPIVEWRPSMPPKSPQIPANVSKMFPKEIL